MAVSNISELQITVNYQDKGVAAGAKKTEESLKNLKEAVEETSNEAPKLDKAMGDLKDKLGDVQKSAKKGTSSLKKFLDQVGRIAKYRAIRAALSAIANGFKEGWKNMYEWSSALGGEFAQAVDSLKNSALIFKNSLAVASAPLIEALAPIVANLASKFAEAATAASRFFAILSGADHYYAVSIGQANAYASATGKATQKLRTLLKFDEINRLEKKNQGGGGSSSGTDTSGMFQRISLDKNTNGMSLWTRLQMAIEDLNFNTDWLKNAKDFLSSKLVAALVGIKLGKAILTNQILGVPAGGIGVAFSAVVLSFAFGNFLVETFGIESTWGKILVDALMGLAAAGLVILAGASVGTAIIVGILAAAALALSQFFIDKNDVKADDVKKKVGNSLGFDDNGNLKLLPNIKVGANSVDVSAGVKTVTDAFKRGLENTTVNARVKFTGEYGGGNTGKFAVGGFPDEGQLFIAREAGPEMVGTLGGRTAVANNDQIVQGIASGVASAQAKQNAILLEQNALLKQLVNKGSGISTGSISSAFERENRRAGTTIIPVGG